MGEEEEVEEGNARQRASSCARGVARRRGAAGVVANGTPAVGSVRDDADGRTDDGGDGSDGTNRNTHNGRNCRADDAAHDDGNCRPDDADSCACGVFGDAGDANGRTRSFSDADDGQRDGRSSLPCDSHARYRWVRNASVVANHVMMRSRGSFPTRSAIGVSETESFSVMGLKRAVKVLPSVFKLAGRVQRMARTLTRFCSVASQG